LAVTDGEGCYPCSTFAHILGNGFWLGRWLLCLRVLRLFLKRILMISRIGTVACEKTIPAPFRLTEKGPTEFSGQAHISCLRTGIVYTKIQSGPLQWGTRIATKQ